jgi:hypothetical protein
LIFFDGMSSAQTLAAELDDVGRDVGSLVTPTSVICSGLAFSNATAARVFMGFSSSAFVGPS